MLVGPTTREEQLSHIVSIFLLLDPFLVLFLRRVFFFFPSLPHHDPNNLHCLIPSFRLLQEINNHEQEATVLSYRRQTLH
jgi:hypothetical protein